MTVKALVPLNDEQVRKYITDGYVKIDYEVDSQIHATITRKLTEMVNQGPNLGNNVLPRVPEFRHILNCPEVRGALISLLGPNYIEHPHRYCHARRPLEEKPGDDVPTLVARTTHQDSYTPMASPRQHYPRLARIIYYPQDTPIELGPTHITPGTSYHKTVTDEDRRTGLPMTGPAGSLWITHFDVIHSAGANVSKQIRHMIKFIYVMRNRPSAPSWDCRDLEWRAPEGLECPWDLEVSWSHMWDWMCGKQNRYESLHSSTRATTPDSNSGSPQLVNRAHGEDLDDAMAAINQLGALGADAAPAVPALASLLNSNPQPLRVAATYALGAIGAPAVTHLIERLQHASRNGGDKEGQVGWDEHAVHMPDEAHALAAIGPPAVDPLMRLLNEDGEWTRICAAFALGEMDRQGSTAAHALTKLLEDNSHRVVRTAIDSLGMVGGDATKAVPRIARFLEESRPSWEQNHTSRQTWCARDRIRVNATIAMMRLGDVASQAETSLIHALDDETGYVSLYAAEALRTMASPTAVRAALEMAMAQRWDPSLSAERPW